MPKRKERTAQMGGFFDFLNPSKEGSIFDAFGQPQKTKKEEAPHLHALPAPKSMLPTVRRDERGITKPSESLKQKLLSIFDAFGPPEEAEKQRGSLIPEEIQETPREIAKQPEAPWEAMFSPSEEAEEIELIFDVLPSKEGPSRFKFVGQKLPTIPYGGGEWRFPTVEDMAQNLSEKIDLDTVFNELVGNRMTTGYQELVAEAAFRGIPLYTPISVIDDKNFYTDFAEFYGIPWSVIESATSKEELMSKVLSPMSLLLTQAFEAMKPEYLPGFFTVDYNGQDGKYWLYYVEPWLGRLPGL